MTGDSCSFSFLYLFLGGTPGSAKLAGFPADVVPRPAICPPPAALAGLHPHQIVYRLLFLLHLYFWLALYQRF